MQPLNHQLSEYDCVPTTIFNALVYLIGRKRIPTKVIKYVYKKSLNVKKGTSGKAIDTIIKYLNRQKLGIKCKIIKGSDANLEALAKYLEDGYIAAYRVKIINDAHYSLAISCDSEFFYFFDPYWDECFPNNRQIARKGIETSNYFYKRDKYKQMVLFKKD